jgi:hypothetical protein
LKRGRFLGGTVPFGSRVGKDGALIELPEQQVTLQPILALRREGLALRAIAAEIRGTDPPVTVRSVLSMRISAPGGAPARSSAAPLNVALRE